MDNNEDRHIYLYAKHWYHHSTNIITDLRIIISERSYGPLTIVKGELYDVDALVNINDAITVLLEITFMYMNHLSDFIELISNTLPEGSWRTGYIHKDTPDEWLMRPLQEKANLPAYDPKIALIYACMHILRFQTVDRIKNIGKCEIGEADFITFPMFIENK